MKTCSTGWAGFIRASMVFKSFDILRQAGFDNLNLDLMFAIPGQTLEIWRATLDEALALAASICPVTRSFTRMTRRCLRNCRPANSTWTRIWPARCMRNWLNGDRPPVSGNTKSPILRAKQKSNEHSVRSPQSASNYLPDCGQWTGDCGHSPSFACRHNVNYWRGGSFYGLGPSATGYVRGVRTKNWSNTQLYCEQLEKGKRAIESREELPPLKRAGETAAFGLRMVAGWPFEEFRRTTNFDLRQEWSADMNQLADRGWAEISPDDFHLTRQGLRFADAAAEMFLR